MQPLARDGLTADQVRELLVGEGVRRGHGMEVLDADGRLVEDISADTQPWTVKYNNDELVHGTLNVPLARELSWATVRLRPFMTLARDDIGTARFDAGVYVPSVPQERHGRSPRIWEVTGRNLLALLDKQVGDGFGLEAGSDGLRPTYLDALRALVAHAGVTVPLQLDGDRQNTRLPADRFWWNTTYLEIASDLLAEIAYTDLHCSPSGAYQAQPVRPLSERGPEWTFDSRPTSQARNADLVAAAWTEEWILAGGFNRWRFVRRGMPYTPTLGDGMFEWTNTDIGPLSVAATGTVRSAPVQTIEAADQAALEGEGLRIIAADMRAEHSATIEVDPLPIAGHRDVVRLLTSARDLTMQVSSWTLTPYGRGTWVLGGGEGGGREEPSEQQVTATITSGTADAGGLRVVLDGATVTSAATALADDSGALPAYEVGTRVRTTVRSPLVPTVQGKETV